MAGVLLFYFAFLLIKNNSQVFKTGSVSLVETQQFYLFFFNFFFFYAYAFAEKKMA